MQNNLFLESDHAHGVLPTYLNFSEVTLLITKPIQVLALSAEGTMIRLMLFSWDFPIFYTFASSFLVKSTKGNAKRVEEL